MSGALVLEHRRLLVELCGTARFERVLASLPEATRQEYESLTSVSWPPVELAEEVLRAAATVLGRDFVKLQEELSRASVERTLSTLWRMLLRFTTDEALVARTPRIYARAFAQGELRTRIVGPGRAEIVVVGWPNMPEFSTRGLRIAVETVLRLAARQNVRVVTESTVDGPRFTAYWSV